MKSASFALGVVFLLSCDARGGDPLKPALEGRGPHIGDGEPIKVAKGNNAFALDLYSRLGKKHGNVVYSPYSLSVALAMLHEGASGETGEQIAKTLHLMMARDRLPESFAKLARDLQGDGEEHAVKLVVANALWGQKGYPFVAEYLRSLERSFQSSLKEVDFASDPDRARMTINRWVEEQTNHKIRELLKTGQVRRSTQFVLANAIYFKGAWLHPFSDSNTRIGEFFMTAEDKARATMMRGTNIYRYADAGDVELLDLKYADGRTSFIIVLPKKIDGLAEVERGLTPARLEGLLKKMKPRRVEAVIPRFKLHQGMNAAVELSGMGMPLAFSEKADFSGIARAKKLSIGSLVHQAYLSLDEKGTEAAAATAIVVERVGKPAKTEPILFRANHPFLFLIRDSRTELILFLGRFVDPEAP